jgi:cation-transporting P-type ATPase I
VLLTAALASPHPDAPDAKSHPTDVTVVQGAREAALEKPLRNDILRRGIATAAPSLAAYLAALGSFGMPTAGSVAFASIVAIQLAQTLALGRNEDGLSRSVLGAVVGSTGLLVAALTVGPLRVFLNLTPPTPLGWILIGAATLSAVPLNRLLASLRFFGSEPNHATRAPTVQDPGSWGVVLSPSH